MKRKIYMCLALTALIGPDVVQAAEEMRNGTPPVMQEVVVTATRRAEIIAKVPSHVTIISAEDIQNSTKATVPDILRSQVGLQVNDITGNGRNFTVDIRGFGETAGLNTLVLVDGRRINQADLSGTDWTLIPLERIEKIEIIRGGRGSVLYGDNASGGVVNIITKEGKGLKAEGKIAAGSYDAFESEATISGSRNELFYALAGSYSNSDGYRDNSDTEAKDFGLNLGYNAYDSLRLNFSGGYHKDSTSLPGAIKESDFAAGVARTATLHPEDFADTEDYYFKGGFELFFLSDSVFKTDISFRKRNSLAFSSFDAGTFDGDTGIDTFAVSQQILIEEELLGFDNSLIIGLDYDDITEDIENESVFFGVPSTATYKLAKKNYGYYIHEEFALNDKISISGGYRYDKAKFSFTPSTPSRTDMDEDLFTAGLIYRFLDNSSAYINFSRSFRYPVIDEIFSFFTNTLNTAIQPQSSKGYEFGLRHYFSDTLFAGINFYRIDTDDEIIYNPGSFANENLDGKTRREGVEISLKKFFRNVSLSCNYVYADAKIKAGEFADKDFPNVPAHKAGFDGQFMIGDDLTLGINGNYVGKRPFISDFVNAHSEQKDYFVLNAKLMYQWRDFTAFADLNNITNEEYSEYGGIDFTGEKGFFPSPKFNFLIGVRANY